MHSIENDELYHQISSFLVKKTGRDARLIHPKSRLYQDLGIDGVEGVELIEDFSMEFSVDIGNLDLSKHFGPEMPLIPLLWLYWRIFNPGKLNKRGQWKMIPITPLDLFESAKLGSWIDLSERPPE